MPRLRPIPEKPKVDPKAAAAEPDIIVEEPDDEAEVEIEDDPQSELQKDEAAVLLQKQLDDLKKSEQIQRDLASQAMRERDEALKRARERDEQLFRATKTQQDLEFDSISSGIAAAKAEADKAQLDIENAISLGDAKGQAEAHRRLAVATANLTRLEEGKEAIEARKSAPIQPTQQASTDPLADSPLPPVAKDYLRAHPDLLTDTRKNARLQGYHWDAIEAGHPEFSPGYFKYMDEKFHYNQPELKIEPEPEPEPVRRIPVSAPVSREVPTSDGRRDKGKVTLTQEERDMAKVAGITLEEYAKQKLKLAEMRASGQYGGDQR